MVDAERRAHEEQARLAAAAAAAPNQDAFQDPQENINQQNAGDQQQEGLHEDDVNLDDNEMPDEDINQNANQQQGNQNNANNANQNDAHDQEPIHPQGVAPGAGQDQPQARQRLARPEYRAEDNPTANHPDVHESLVGLTNIVARLSLTMEDAMTPGGANAQQRAGLTNMLAQVAPVLSRIKREAKLGHTRAATVHEIPTLTQIPPNGPAEDLPPPNMYYVQNFGSSEDQKNPMRCLEFLRSVINVSTNYRNIKTLLKRHTTGEANQIVGDQDRENAALHHWIRALEVRYADLCSEDQARAQLATRTIDETKPLPEATSAIRHLARMATRFDTPAADRLKNEKKLARQVILGGISKGLASDFALKEQRRKEQGRKEMEFTEFVQELEMLRKIRNPGKPKRESESSAVKWAGHHERYYDPRSTIHLVKQWDVNAKKQETPAVTPITPPRTPVIGLPRKPVAETPRPDKLELRIPNEGNPTPQNYTYTRERSGEGRQSRDSYRREEIPDNRERARTPEGFRRSRSPYRDRRDPGSPNNRGFSPGRGEEPRQRYGDREYNSWGSGSGRRPNQDSMPFWDRGRYPQNEGRPRSRERPRSPYPNNDRGRDRRRDERTDRYTRSDSRDRNRSPDRGYRQQTYPYNNQPSGYRQQSPGPRRSMSPKIDIKSLNVTPAECMRCGREGHMAFGPTSEKCPLAGYSLTSVCQACGKGGHKAEYCPNPTRGKNY